MFSFFKKKTTPDFPEDIVVERIEPSDEEILEEWKRICVNDHQDIHGVYASIMEGWRFRVGCHL